MSSASVTEFYGLTQYVGTDKPSFTDNNEAFQKVDEDLHEVVQSSESQAETISGLQEDVGSLGDRVTAAEGDIDDAEIAIGALQNKETLQDNAIAAVKAAALDMVCAYNEAAAQSTHAYAVGDFFRYQDVLYKATAAIAIDDTIVPNVNCSATNVTEELLAIISTGAVDSTARAGIEALTLVVGNLADLTTTDKTSIVNAINEVKSELDGDSPVLLTGTSPASASAHSYIALPTGYTTANTLILSAMLDTGSGALYNCAMDYLHIDVSITNDNRIDIYADASATITSAAVKILVQKIS